MNVIDMLFRNEILKWGRDFGEKYLGLKILNERPIENQCLWKSMFFGKCWHLVVISAFLLNSFVAGWLGLGWPGWLGWGWGWLGWRGMGLAALAGLSGLAGLAGLAGGWRNLSDTLAGPKSVAGDCGIPDRGILGCRIPD